MIPCYKHHECAKGYVQSPEDVNAIMKCMIQRGIIKKTIKGKYIKVHW